jgi:hypothetical protein
MKKNTYEFVIHLGVQGGQVFDECEAPTGAMAQSIMENRYPNAKTISIRNIQYNTED